MRLPTNHCPKKLVFLVICTFAHSPHAANTTLKARYQKMRALCEKLLNPPKKPVPDSVFGKKLEEGHRIYDDDGPAWALDADSLRDLKVTEGGLIGRLGKGCLTPYGKPRLLGMLRNPSLSTAEILRRQSAVKFLVDHPDVRASVRAHLQELVNRGIFQVYESFLTNKYAVRADEGRSADLAVAVTIVGGLVLDVILLNFKYLITTTVLGFRNLTEKIAMRNHLLNFRGLFDTTPKLRDALPPESTEILAAIRDTLDAVDHPAHPLQLYNTARKFRGVLLPTLGSIVDFANISPNTLRVPRRSLAENQASFAKILGAIAELDVFQSLAERHATTKDLVFPDILPDEQKPSIEISEGHSPTVQEERGHDDSVANSISFGAVTGKTVINIAGHSGRQTFLEMIGEYVLAGSVGASLPAKSVRFTPMGLQTYVVGADGLPPPGLFSQIEVAADLLERAATGEKALYLFSGLFKGSPPTESQHIKPAIIEYFAHRPNTLGIIVTNDPNLLALVNTNREVANMTLAINEEGERVLHDGDARALPSEVSMAIAAGMPEFVIERIKQLTDEHEQALERERQKALDASPSAKFPFVQTY